MKKIYFLSYLCVSAFRSLATGRRTLFFVFFLLAALYNAQTTVASDQEFQQIHLEGGAQLISEEANIVSDENRTLPQKILTGSSKVSKKQVKNSSQRKELKAIEKKSPARIFAKQTNVFRYHNSSSSSAFRVQNFKLNVGISVHSQLIAALSASQEFSLKKYSDYKPITDKEFLFSTVNFQHTYTVRPPPAFLL